MLLRMAAGVRPRGYQLGSVETLLLPARTPTIAMICVHWPSMVWTSHHPRGQSGSWVPVSSASSTRSLIGVTIALALPWPAEALCCPAGPALSSSPELEHSLGLSNPCLCLCPHSGAWSTSWMCALPPAPALPYFEDKQNKDFMFTTPLYLGSLGFETEGSTSKRSCADRNVTE